MSIAFLDTSAVLCGELEKHKYCYISPITLSELEHIKTSDKPDHTKYLAREAVRTIINNPAIVYATYNQKTVDRLLKKYNFLSNINDHRILCEAVLVAKNHPDEDVIFYTNDAAQYVLGACIRDIKMYYLQQSEQKHDTSFCGWGKYYPNNEEMNHAILNKKWLFIFCKIKI